MNSRSVSLRLKNSNTVQPYCTFLAHDCFTFITAGFPKVA